MNMYSQNSKKLSSGQKLDILINNSIYIIYTSRYIVAIRYLIFVYKMLLHAGIKIIYFIL